MGKLLFGAILTLISFFLLSLSVLGQNAPCITGYTGWLVTGHSSSGCGSGVTCGLGSGADQCSYVASYDGTNLINSRSYCPQTSTIAYNGCYASPGQTENFNNLQCGVDYNYIVTYRIHQVNCTDPTCSAYAGQGEKNYLNGFSGNATMITATSSMANGTKTSNTCNVIGGSVYSNYTLCNNGVFQDTSDLCSYGCLPTLGCLSQPQANPICLPNLVINGTCNLNYATQQICSNDGTYIISKTVACGSNQYCQNGQCYNNVITTTTTSEIPSAPGSLGTSCAWSKPCQAGLICTFDPLNILNQFWTCKNPNPILGNGTTTTTFPTPPPTSEGYIVSNQTQRPDHWFIQVGNSCSNIPGEVIFNYCPASSTCVIKCTSINYPTHIFQYVYNPGVCHATTTFGSSNYYLPAQCVENSSLYSVCNEYTGFLLLDTKGSGGNTQNFCGLGVNGGDICTYYPEDINGNIITKTERIYSWNYKYLWLFNLSFPYWTSFQPFDYNAYCPQISPVDPGRGCGALPGQIESFTNLDFPNGYYGIISNTYKTINCLDSNCSQYQNTTNGAWDIRNIVGNPIPVGSKINGICAYDNSLNKTVYSYQVCNNTGGLSNINEQCYYGCMNSYGCIPSEFLNSSCLPNFALNGTCLNTTTVTQSICSNDGTYYLNKTYNCPAGLGCNPLYGICMPGNFTGNFSAPYQKQANAGMVSRAMFTPIASILILLTVSCAGVYFFLDDEFIPILIFTIGNFVMALLNYFQYGYLLSLFGIEMLILSYQNSRTAPKT